MLRKFATRRRMALALSLTLVWAVLALSHERVVCIDSAGQRVIEPALLGQCLPAMACDADGQPSSDSQAESSRGAECQDELLGSIESIARDRVTTELPPVAFLATAIVPQPTPGWTAADVQLPVRRGPPLRATSVLIAQTMVLRI